MFKSTEKVNGMFSSWQLFPRLLVASTPVDVVVLYHQGGRVLDRPPRTITPFYFFDMSGGKSFNAVKRIKKKVSFFSLSPLSVSLSCRSAVVNCSGRSH
jgi:hypothetical protein